MISIISVTSVNYNIQIKNVIFIKSHVKQLIESIYKTTVSELFNAAEVRIYQFISKIYKIVFNFKIARKLTKDVVVSRLTIVFDSRLIFHNFSNFVYQICFEILIYCDLMNRTISINIELTHLLCVFVLRAHVSPMSSIVLFSFKFI